MQDAIYKTMVDNAMMRVNPVMMCSSQAPMKPATATQVAAQQQRQQMAMTQNMQVRSQQIKHLLNNLLPEQCRKHVYKVDHEHSIIDDCEIVKWTFYNDLSVRLKVAANIMLDSGEAEPIIEDFELWQADALMKCEAGEDVWPRPKPESVFAQMGPSTQQQSGQANSSNSLGQVSQSPQNSQGQSNILGGLLGLLP